MLSKMFWTLQDVFFFVSVLQIIEILFFSPSTSDHNAGTAKCWNSRFHSSFKQKAKSMEFLGYLKKFHFYLVWPFTTLKIVSNDFF